MTNGATERISLRITPGIIKRAEALRKMMGKDPTQAALGKITQSMVLKVALAEGLAILEKRYK